MELNRIGHAGPTSISSTATNQIKTTFRGHHSIQLGTNPPIRLDKIGTSYIKPLGIRSNTRFANATKGMQTQAKIMLDSLLQKDGNLNVKTLIKACNTFNVYAQHQKHNSSTEYTPMATVKEMAHSVSMLSNDELTYAYSTLLSHDMSDLKTAIMQEAKSKPSRSPKMTKVLANIMDLEALIVSEISRRVAIATQPATKTERMLTLDQMYGYGDNKEHVTERGDHDLKSTAMAGVIDHMAASDIHDKGRSEEYENTTARHKMTPLNIRQLGDTLRNAELTININPDILFGADGDNKPFPLDEPDFHIKNMFQLMAEGKDKNSDAYREMRTTAENSLFPELTGNLSGETRPIYGALNMLHMPLGACANYGACAVVLKPEVKKTATFTFGDTLKIPVVNIAADKEEAFLAQLSTYENDFTPQTMIDIRNPNSDLRRAITDMFANPISSPIASLMGNRLVTKVLANLHMSEDGDQTYVFQNSLYQTCRDPNKSFSQVASYDHLENLLSAMSEASQLQLDVVNREHFPATTFYDADYVEAQIPKPVTLDDVAEIRINDDYYTAEHVAKIQEWAQKKGVNVTFVSSAQNEAIVATESESAVKKRVKAIHEPVAPRDVRKLVNDFPLQDKAKAIINAHPKAETLRNLIGDAPVIRGTFLNRVVGKLYEKAQASIGVSLMAFVDPTLVNEHMEDVLKNELDVKIKLLEKLDTMEFDNLQQKQAFAKWVLESKALNTETEMVHLYTGMKSNAKKLDDFLTGPDAQDGQKFCKVMTTIHRENCQLMDQISEGFSAAQFGTDDLNAEFNRLGFLTMSYLENSTDGKQKLQQLARLTTGADFATLKIVFDSLADKSYNNKELSEDEGIQMGVARSLSLYVSCLGQTIQNLTNRAPLQSSLVPVNTIPKTLRQSLLEDFPEVKAIVDKHWPEETPMRKITHSGHPDPNVLESSFENRRKFLLNVLDVYQKHDLTFDLHADFHGRSHAVRVFVFANVLGNILKDRGYDVDMDTLVYAAAGHDLGRQGSGDDIWEKDSAEKTIAAIPKLRDADLGEEFRKGIQEAITSNQDNATTLEALLLHCSDSLDYTRISEIKMEFFPFMREPIIQDGRIIPVDQDLRNQLVSEAVRLAQLTHPVVATRKLMAEYTEKAGAINATNKDLEAYDIAKQRLFEIMEDRAKNDTHLQVLERVEQIIRDNATVFPILHKYYH